MTNTGLNIPNAIQILREGGILVYPTDTAFGIGCRIDDRMAVDRLFALRKRPTTKATPVLVRSVSMALAYFSSPCNIVRRLMDKYWPGALTIVAPCKTSLVYSPIRGNGKTIGLRMPDHMIALQLIEGVGIPIIGTSANFFGQPTPYSTSDLDPKLISLVDGVVAGACMRRAASTVVDCTFGKPRILRQGAVILKKNDYEPGN